METVRENADLLLVGLVNTLQLSLLIIVFGTIIGVFGGLALLYGPRPMRLLPGTKGWAAPWQRCATRACW